MNALQGYRTFLVSAIAVAVAVAGFVLNVAAGVGPIDAQASVPTILMALLMAALRVVTSTPPGKGAQTSPTLPAAETLVAQVEALLAQRSDINRVLSTLATLEAGPPNAPAANPQPLPPEAAPAPAPPP